MVGLFPHQGDQLLIYLSHVVFSSENKPWKDDFFESHFLLEVVPYLGLSGQ